VPDRSVGAAGDECCCFAFSIFVRIRTMCYSRDFVDENLLFSCGASSLCFPSLVRRDPLLLLAICLSLALDCDLAYHSSQRG
jgi:hypothetical protein